MPFENASMYVAAYEDAYEKLKGAIAGLSEEEIGTRPAPAKWSIKEILCHLMDGEIIWVGRLKRIIAEDNPFLPSYDQDKFAANLHYCELNTKAVLMTFGMLRSTTAEVLAMVSDDVWQRKGTHDTRGEVTLREMLVVMSEHDTNHINQIYEIREKTLGRRS